MKNTDFILGSIDIVKKPMKPYSDDAVNFLKELSNIILSDRSARMYPDVISVGYWCRTANINRKKAEFEDDKLRLGRGLAFHIAPSNVPVNFAFSFFFSLLSGNANIVRIPSKPFPQVNILINAIKKCCENFPEIKKRTAFVRYEANDEITEEFSKMADVRIIWGGDRTVEHIRSFKAKPRCIDISFSDRYSIAIINANKVAKTSDDEITRIAHGFYNDTFLMDQNACSSPRLVVWQNYEKEAHDKFWKAVKKETEKYNLQAALAVDKYTMLCSDAIEKDYINSLYKDGNMLICPEIVEIPECTDCISGKGGYFYEYFAKDIGEISGILSEKIQTITYFGVNPEELREFIIKEGLMGVDRIVPFGSAMDIDVIWDGYDLVGTLSRIIDIR